MLHKKHKGTNISACAIFFIISILMLRPPAVTSLVSYTATVVMTPIPPVVTNYGSTLPSYSSGGFAKYRVLGTQNIWVGTAQSINQTGATRAWTKPGNNSVSFKYDRPGDKLQNIFKGYQLNYTSVSQKTKVSPATWNVVVITIRNSSPGTALSLNNISIGSYYLGSLTVAPSNTNYWTITNYSFGSSFTLTGTIYLSGTFSGGSESNKIVIEVGKQ